MSPVPASDVKPGQLILDDRLAGVGVVWSRSTHPSGVAALLVHVPGHGARQLVVPPGHSVLTGPAPGGSRHVGRVLRATACAATWFYLRRGTEPDRTRAHGYAAELAHRFGGTPEEHWQWLLNQARETAPYPRWEDASQDAP